LQFGFAAALQRGFGDKKLQLAVLDKKMSPRRK
jgi:hypothetical protein